MGSMQTKKNLLGVTTRGVFKHLDVLGKNLGFVFAVVDVPDNQDGGPHF